MRPQSTIAPYVGPVFNSRAFAPPREIAPLQLSRNAGEREFDGIVQNNRFDMSNLGM